MHIEKSQASDQHYTLNRTGPDSVADNHDASSASALRTQSAERTSCLSQHRGYLIDEIGITGGNAHHKVVGRVIGQGSGGGR